MDLTGHLPAFGAGLVAGSALTTGLFAWLAGNRAWRHANFAAVRVRWPMVLGMRLRGTPAVLVIDATVALAKRGKKVSPATVEAVYLTNRARVVDSADLVAAVEHDLALAGSRESAV